MENERRGSSFFRISSSCKINIYICLSKLKKKEEDNGSFSNFCSSQSISKDDQRMTKQRPNDQHIPFVSVVDLPRDLTFLICCLISSKRACAPLSLGSTRFSNSFCRKRRPANECQTLCREPINLVYPNLLLKSTKKLYLLVYQHLVARICLRRRKPCFRESKRLTRSKMYGETSAACNFCLDRIYLDFGRSLCRFLVWSHGRISVVVSVGDVNGRAQTLH